MGPGTAAGRCRQVPAGEALDVCACCGWQGFMQCKSYISAGPAWQGGEPLSVHRATEPYREKKKWISIVLSAPATTWKATLAFPPLLSEGFAGSKTILKLFMGQGVTNLQLAARKTQKKHRNFNENWRVGCCTGGTPATLCSAHRIRHSKGSAPGRIHSFALWSLIYLDFFF